MGLVRPALCSFARAGRRLQAQPGTAFRASGTFCGDQTRGSCSSFVTGRKRALTLTPCLANAPTAGPLQAYAKLVLKGEIREDRHQVEALHLLQTLHASLEGYRPQVPLREQHLGLWSSVLNSLGGNNDNGSSSSGQSQPAENTPRGAYMHGGVGTGKTFMMDLFFQESPVTSKRRVHFLDFMLDVHQRMHKCRQRGISGEVMVSTVTDEILQEGWLLCFDEMQVTDIADAMMIRQLFSGLWGKGAVVVATSNRHPDHLYHKGLQRAAFLPFIEQLKERSHVHSLEASSTDYRLLKGADSVSKVYLSPDNAKSREEFDLLWKAISGGVQTVPVNLSAQGRSVRIPRAVKGGRVAMMTFDELCGKALGAADFTAISEAFHTLFVHGVPMMNLVHINQARRFRLGQLITLVDVMYERGVKLVCLAEALPLELFDPGPGRREDMPDEVFAFGRTASRLTEMQGQEYLKRTWRPSENYLVRFTGEQLSDEELVKIWEAYDVDGDGRMDREELSFLMEDLCEAKNGHRNVPTEALDTTFKAMDVENDGYVSNKTFMRFGRRFGLTVWW
ncbi:unnamed protein product [Ectocarpus fasciculatus]